VSRFGGRVADLERRLGGGGCPACGLATGKPITFVAVGTRGRDEPFDPRPCPVCGRPTVFTLKLGEAGLGEEA
jgi:hypothetical protein